MHGTGIRLRLHLHAHSSVVPTWQRETTGHSRTNRTRNRTARGSHLLDSALVEAADRRSLIYAVFSLNECVDPTNSRFSRGIGPLHLLIFSVTTYNTARTARRHCQLSYHTRLLHHFRNTGDNECTNTLTDKVCPSNCLVDWTSTHRIEDWGAGSNSPILGIARGTLPTSSHALWEHSKLTQTRRSY